jgi:hypothetical protein
MKESKKQEDDFLDEKIEAEMRIKQLHEDNHK